MAKWNLERNMDLESWYIKILGFMKETGKINRKMDMGLKNFLTDVFIKEVMLMANLKA